MNELALAIRRLLRSSGFTVAAVTTLALGIGATTAIVTLANALLLRPLPYRNVDRLVHLWQFRAGESESRSELSFQDYRDWQASATRTVERFGGYSWPRLTVRGSQGAEELQGARVTDSFFDVLGVHAALGRTFVRGEDVTNGPRVALISDAFWRRRFGADREVIRKTIDIDGETFEIVGVLPETFHFAPARGAEVWIPLRPSGWRLGRSGRWVKTIALLKPGVTTQAADRELDALSAELARRYPDTNRGASAEVMLLRDFLIGPAKPTVLVLTFAALFVVLIACANVASLMLERVAARQQDIAVRFALGATRIEVASALVAEALVLAVVGAVAGAFIGLWALRALVLTVPADLIGQMPYLGSLTPDARVFGVVSLVVAACVLLISIWPATRAARGWSFVQRGVAGGREKRRLRRSLVVVEIALALMLLTGAALTLRSMAALANVETGYRAEGVLTLRVAFPAHRYHGDAELAAAQSQAIERVARATGGAVALVDVLPSMGLGGTTTVTTEAGGTEHAVNIRAVTPDYFRAMSIQLLRGRAFVDGDRPGAPLVAIVNRQLARRVFGTENAAGRTLLLGEDAVRIEGVVMDERLGRADQAITPAIYMSLAQAGDATVSMVVQAGANPASVSGTVVETLKALDRDIAVSGVAPMTTIIASQPATFLRRASTVVISAYAGVSLFLALIGIYAVIAESVTACTRELAVRISLGATPADILGMITRDGLSLGFFGLGVGLAGAFVLTRFMRSLLFGVDAHDPIAFVSVAVLLLLTAMLASLVPAIRALRIDPPTALRQE